MKECSKRQHEVYKGEDRDRCIHTEADTYLQIVTESVCDACPVRQLLPTKNSCPGCKPPPAPQPPKPQAVPENAQYLGDYKDLKVVYDNPNHYPLPVLETPPEYPECPYRSKGREGFICSITNLPVTPDICHRCTEITEIEERKNQAKLGTKIYNYFGAVRRWVASGRPRRSKEEIERLFQEHCKGCDMYDAKKHACKSCGCNVSEDADPLDNKLAMATEHCPLGRF